MPSALQTKGQIEGIVRCLIETSLADDQTFPYLDGSPTGLASVTFPGAEFVSIALRDRAYDEIYAELVESRAYVIKMLDGALIQMMYQFFQGTLTSHRLAFFPSPYLDDFQSNSEIYLTDELYADVVARNIVHTPMRFDYDSEELGNQKLPHPKSHLTLGQYENCRIPVSRPLTPLRFADFLLRNFYHTAHERYANKLPVFGVGFDESINSAERGLCHMVIPA